MDSTTYALPATPKQIAYARSLALRNKTLLPWEVQQDRRSLSAWIEAQLKPVSDMDRLPTSKQVAFAEKLGRLFFVFADRHDHPWLKRIDPQAFDLGNGDRALVQGGKIHPRYRIMVPEDFVKPEAGNRA